MRAWGFGEVWPGVFLSLRAHGDNVEKLFTVRPGAEPSRIRMRIAGAKSLRVDEAGALVATTGLGEVTFTPPVAYQEQDGLRRAVMVAYRARGREYGFSLGSHDPALPVVIDPLLQATYLGGSGDDDWYRPRHPPDLGRGVRRRTYVFHRFSRHDRRGAAGDDGEGRRFRRALERLR